MSLPTSLPLLVTACITSACLDRPVSASSVNTSEHATSSISAPSTSTASSAKELRVMTYNVNFGIPGDESTLDVLRDNPVEVVMLQETTREWEPSLRKTLGARYPYAHFVHSSRWTAGGSAIFSRFPLEDVEELPSPIGWFSAMRAVVDAPDGAVELVNVHLRPAVSDSGSWVEGYLTTGPSRQKEMESYFERFDPKLPTIVAGDFNEDDTGHALRMLSREGFANAMTETGSDASTWRWTAYGLPLRLRLDHVAYDDDGFVIEEARVLDGGRSDHLAVVATLRRRH